MHTAQKAVIGRVYGGTKRPSGSSTRQVMEQIFMRQVTTTAKQRQSGGAAAKESSGRVIAAPCTMMPMETKMVSQLSDLRRKMRIPTAAKTKKSKRSRPTR